MFSYFSSTKFNKKIRSLRQHSPLLVLIILIALIVGQQIYNNSSLKKSIVLAKNWPSFPQSHLRLSVSLANNGYEQLAKKELLIAQKQILNLKLLDLDKALNQPMEMAKKQVLLKTRLEKELAATNQLLLTYPYSWQILLKKARLSYQLGQNDNYRQALKKANWLSPNNRFVKKMFQK